MKQTYSNAKFGKTVRRNYSKSPLDIEVPQLLDFQLESYKHFLENEVSSVFDDYFPIKSKNNRWLVEILKVHPVKLPKNETAQVAMCRTKGSTYESKIEIDVRVTNIETGEVKKSTRVLFSNIPLMTTGGSFIVNGSEKAIIGQVVRSPGLYFEDLKSGKHGDRTTLNKVATLNPNRGSWIELVYKDYKLMKQQPSAVNIIINKNKKTPITTMLLAMGINFETAKTLLSDHILVDKSILATQKALKAEDPEEARKFLFKVLALGDRYTQKDIPSIFRIAFYNKRSYDLSETGRFKLNQKLNITSRLLGHELAEAITSVKGKVLFEKGHVFTSEDLVVLEKHYAEKKIVPVLPKGLDLSLIPHDPFNPNVEVQTGPKLFEEKGIHTVKVLLQERDANGKRIVFPIVGNDQEQTALFPTFGDIIASMNYMIGLENGIGFFDDIDSLANRRIRTVSELVRNQLKISMQRLERKILENLSSRDPKLTITPKSIFDPKMIKKTIEKDFFNSSQLSQFLNQTNPLADIGNKRRITALGPGGLTRDTAMLEVRSVHDSYYGRICPVETPEGPNIGLILNLASYAKINKFGFLLSPYRIVKNNKPTKEIIYLTFDEEQKHYIAQAVEKLNDKGEFINAEIVARRMGALVKVNRKSISLMDAAPNQIVSVGASAIPFLENDDANRALMGSNMQRQAIPLLKAEAPIVGTGIEKVIASHSNHSVKAADNGTVTFVDGTKIVIKEDSGENTYDLVKFRRSNQGTVINQKPIVTVGEKVKKGDVIADGPSMEKGELAIGKDVTVAFTTLYGLNYEDAVIISERLSKEDVYTSVHLHEYKMTERKTQLGDETITPEIPNTSKHSLRHLGADGIAAVGSFVESGDVLVGKITPRGKDELSTEEKLLGAILGEKIENVRDSSLRVPHGITGIVHSVDTITKDDKDANIEVGINKVVKITILQKRKIKAGDKMAGRHGNKGVVSIVLPAEDMPFLEDGTPVDVVLNPLGVPSRMNIGQVLELHAGMAGSILGEKVVTPAFSGMSNDELSSFMKEAKLDPSGKVVLYDGISGERFDQKVAVGKMYMLKLDHMVDDKLHARSIGPYSLITQQPLGGKAQNGGQRFGEMETWALEAYGASHILKEIMTYKSDDVRGRSELYSALIRGNPLPKARAPESFRVLEFELRGLGISLEYRDNEGKTLDFDKGLPLIEDENLK